MRRDSGGFYGSGMADEFSQRYADLVSGSYDCVDRIVLNAYFSLGHNPGGFRVWWRRLHGSDNRLDDTHLMRMAGRLARRVKAWGAARGVPVIFCKAGERKHAIAEDYLATHEVTGPGGVPGLGRQGPGDGVEGETLGERGDHQPGEEVRVRQSLLPHHGPGLGPRDDQDVRASTVRRADHPQRPRVRGLPGAPGADSLRQGRQLLHRRCRSGGPG